MYYRSNFESWFKMEAAYKRTLDDINYDLTFAYDMSIGGEYKLNYATWKFGRFWFRVMVKLTAKMRNFAMRRERGGTHALRRIQLNLFRKAIETDELHLSFFTKIPLFRI